MKERKRKSILILVVLLLFFIPFTTYAYEIEFFGDEGKSFEYKAYKKGKIVELIGSVVIKGKNFIIKTEKVVINRLTSTIIINTPFKMKLGEKIFEGRKLIYNYKENFGNMFDVKGYSKPVFFNAKEIHTLSKDIMFLEKISTTTCDYKPPHYRIKAKKAIIYSNDKIVLYNVIYEVADVPLFYLPILIRWYYSTGIITAYGHTDEWGHFLQNTYIFYGQDSSGKVFLDLYQKTGEALGFYYKNSNIQLSVAGADYTPVYYDENLKEFINLKADGEYGKEHKLLWKSNLFTEIKISEQEKLRMHIETYKDRYFSTYFERRFIPKTTLDILKLDISKYYQINPKNELNWYIEYIYFKGNSKNPFQMNIKFQRKLVWINGKSELSNQEIPYFPSEELLPLISYKKEFKIYNTNFSILTDGNLTFRKRYSYGELVEERLTTNNKLGIGYELTFPKLLIKLTPKLFYGISYAITKNPTDAEKYQDEKDRYQYIESEDKLYLGEKRAYIEITYLYQRKFLEGIVDKIYSHIGKNEINLTMFLNPLLGSFLKVNGGYDFKKEIVDKKLAYKDIVVEGGFFLDFIRGFTTKLDYQMFPEISNKPIPLHNALEIKNKYTYYTSYKKSKENQLEIRYIFGGIDIGKIFKIETISLGTIWYHNYINYYLDYATLSFFTKIKLTKYLSVEININSKNEDVYKYREGISLIDDIINGLYVFDKEKRDKSLFLLQNVSLSIRHNLHKWVLEFFWEMSRKKIHTGTYHQNVAIYYENIFYLSFYLKDFPLMGFKKKKIKIIEPENIH